MSWNIFLMFCHIVFQVVDSLRQGHQAMVFVHSRKDTVKTAEKLVYLFHIPHEFAFICLGGSKFLCPSVN